MTGAPLRGAIAVVHAAAFIVPAGRRREWREQWRAELWHYALWLSRESRGPAAAAALLTARALGALPHAFQLRAIQWSPRMLQQDLTFAWRMLVRRPAFTLVAVLILGLGIGANTTIFSWMQTVLFTPLGAVPEQDRILVVNGTSATRDNLSWSYPNYVDLRAAQPAGVQDLVAFRLVPMNLRVSDEPVRVFGEIVTPNFFEFFGVTPPLGRAFRPDEGTAPGRDAVAVISDALWRRTFGGDPSVVGRTVELDGHPFTIIGVAPPAFHGSNAALRLEVFVPIGMQQAVIAGDRLGDRSDGWLEVNARIAAGHTAAQVQMSLATAAARLAEQYPDVNRGRGARAVPLWRAGAGNILLPVLGTLMALVALVLLIACANVAGLLLTRAAGRQRELAIRLAVGAGRWRIMRQLLVENLFVSSAGCAAGLLVAYWASGTLNAFVPRTPYPVVFDGGLDAASLLFAIALAVLTAIVSGVMPAWRASRPDVGATLKSASPTATGGRGRLRQGLVIAQLALSVVLLVCASLFARSLGHAASIDPGFSLRQGLLASIDLLPAGYDAARGRVFIEQAIERVSALPHVTGVSVARSVPLDLGGGSDTNATVDGYTAGKDEDVPTYYNQVGPGYFETMGIALMRGRGFTARDTAGQPRVAVINETMARRYWANAIQSAARFVSAAIRSRWSASRATADISG